MHTYNICFITHTINYQHVPIAFAIVIRDELQDY